MTMPMPIRQPDVRPGRGYPLGATVESGGVHFAIVSRYATRVWLMLYDSVTAQAPVREIELDPLLHRLGDTWAVFVEGLEAGALYMYRVDGPYLPRRGRRFRMNVPLLDPYAKAVVGNIPAHEAKCVVVEAAPPWAAPLRPGNDTRDTVIYEMHVRGFTRHESSGVTHSGTYRGLIERIPYLRDLGVTAVELLPVQECGERELAAVRSSSGPLVNYWGYNPICFFAPNHLYGADGGPGEVVREFRAMVDALHEAGIEVILDVVFNHTAEYDQTGKTLCYRGIADSMYYLLEEDGRYTDFTGCGNTLRCNHPVVRHMIIECLRYWVSEMRVDGFRFDLASVLARDRHGQFTQQPALIESITEDPILCHAKLIAEPWDVGGAYQVGSFGNARWAEWNDRYRDDVRRFWRGDTGFKDDFALRLTGSPDVFQAANGRGPLHSVNYITSHDGFTLADLVSYERKHNEANGQDNRDGTDANYSWNYGHEGATDNTEIAMLRTRVRKSMFASLFLSLGIPMMLGGDEFGRTQQGNNNAYCHDDELSWFDWRLLDRNAGLHRFCREMIAFRKANPVFSRNTYFTGRPSAPGAAPDVLWYDSGGNSQTWTSEELGLACRIAAAENDGTELYLIFQPGRDPIEFHIPEGDWLVRIDTAEASPRDIAAIENARRVSGAILAGRQSVVVLARPKVQTPNV